MLDRLRAFGPGTAVLVLGGAFFVGHLVSLASAPYDLDGVNFALALRTYDVTKHQPHPPGYPVFVWLGSLVHKTLQPLLVTPDAAPTLAATRALAIVNAVAGSFAVLPLLIVCVATDPSRRRALLATLVTLTAPLFWFSASRSVSDTAGLAGAVAAQALCAIAIFPGRVALLWPAVERLGVRLRQDDRALIAWLFTCGAVAGVVLGLRAQTIALTAPWLLAVWCVARRSAIRDAAVIAFGFVAGASAWAIPLLITHGGPAPYLEALRNQAGEDLAFADIVWREPTLRKIAHAFHDTFFRPWGHGMLAVSVSLLATAGFAALARRDRRGAVLLVLGIAPYIVVHLLFHETAHIRYALPLVPPTALLAVCGLDALVRQRTSLAAVALAAASLAVAAPAAFAASRDGSPFYQAYHDLQMTASQGTERQPVIGMHHSVALALRGESWPVETVPVGRDHELMDLESLWLNGDQRPVWFLASSRRTDLALVDPVSRRLLRRYRWRERSRRLLAGTRPRGVDWHVIDTPKWFAGEGWSLTPEVGGQTEIARRRGRPAHAAVYVRRRDEPAILMIGGRNRGNAPARVAVRAREHTLATWDVASREGFLRFLTIPADVLAMPTRYVRLLVRTSALGGDAAANVAFDQLDVRSSARPLVGFGEGWYEPESDPENGTVWRWSSERANLCVRSLGRNVRLHFTGEAAEEFGSRGQVMSVTAGDTLLGRFPVAGRFDVSLYLPSLVLDRSDGRVLIEAHPSFVPGLRLTSHGRDTRRLALRAYEVHGEFVP